MQLYEKIPNGLPVKYRKTIYSYITELLNDLGDILKLVILIGSTSSGQIIEEWSDIDIILVLEEYKIEYVNVIRSIVQKYPIKIGNTIYSKIEFENKKIDPKTYYYLLLVQENYINVQYKTVDLIIPNITITECKEQYITWLTEHFHSYKRMWLYQEIPEEKTREIFKNTYLIMKARLIINNYRPQNYKQVFDWYSEKFNYKRLEFERVIKDIQMKKYNKDKMIDYAKKFSEEISNKLKI